MKNADAKMKVLTEAPKLKKFPEYKKVFVMQDLTRRQQEVDKVLRTKLKEQRERGATGLKIKKGKIVHCVDGTELVYYTPPPHLSA